jgi:hypothetical protein
MNEKDANRGDSGRNQRRVSQQQTIPFGAAFDDRGHRLA